MVAAAVREGGGPPKGGGVQGHCITVVSRYYKMALRVLLY